MLVSGFDWDNGNWPKCGKHGVTRNEIEELFTARLSVFPVPEPAQAEQRLLAIGMNGAGRHLLVVFTLREPAGQHLIRPISARFMHEKERRHYEQQIAAQEAPGLRK
ncbi:hypothetical protein ATER59S_04025 [Aquamicrobium terrae]